MKIHELLSESPVVNSSTSVWRNKLPQSNHPDDYNPIEEKIHHLSDLGIKLEQPTSWKDMEPTGRFADKNIHAAMIKRIFAEFGQLTVVKATELWHDEPLTPTQPIHKIPKPESTGNTAAFIVKFSPKRMYLVDTSTASGIKIKQWAKIIA